MTHAINISRVDPRSVPRVINVTAEGQLLPEMPVTNIA
jgi:hypothetical protein